MPYGLPLLQIQLARTESAPLDVRIRFSSHGRSEPEFDVFPATLVKPRRSLAHPPPRRVPHSLAAASGIFCFRSGRPIVTLRGTRKPAAYVHVENSSALGTQGDNAAPFPAPLPPHVDVHRSDAGEMRGSGVGVPRPPGANARPHRAHAPAAPLPAELVATLIAPECICPNLLALSHHVANFDDGLHRGAFANMAVSRCKGSDLSAGGMRPRHFAVVYAGRRRMKEPARRLRALPNLDGGICQGGETRGGEMKGI
ncbi:hypothetical protein B0H19DRAFT_1271869 [Mycena capillaripes]|nr:hypothetical protein B0H19DRAFT_1271869 [Mycena capillaripes]